MNTEQTSKNIFMYFLSFLPTFRDARNLETLNLMFLRIYWSYLHKSSNPDHTEIES